MARRGSSLSKSARFSWWLGCSIAVHVGLLNAHSAEQHELGSRMGRPMTFELLEVPKEIPVSIAVSSGQGSPIDLGSTRAPNRASARSGRMPDSKPIAVRQSQAVPPTTPEAAAHPGPSEQGEDIGPTSSGGGTAVSAEAALLPKASVGTSQTPGTNISHARADYYSLLRAAVERHREYPRAARRARMQGTVVLRLSVSREGQLLSVGVSKSSGEDTLDDAALSAVRMTGTFPSAPVEVTGDQVTLELPFVFRLK